MHLGLQQQLSDIKLIIRPSKHLPNFSARRDTPRPQLLPTACALHSAVLLDTRNRPNGAPTDQPAAQTSPSAFFSPKFGHLKFERVSINLSGLASRHHFHLTPSIQPTQPHSNFYTKLYSAKLVHRRQHLYIPSSQNFNK